MYVLPSHPLLRATPCVPPHILPTQPPTKPIPRGPQPARLEALIDHQSDIYTHLPPRTTPASFSRDNGDIRFLMALSPDFLLTQRVIVAALDTFHDLVVRYGATELTVSVVVEGLERARLFVRILGRVPCPGKGERVG